MADSSENIPEVVLQNKPSFFQNVKSILSNRLLLISLISLAIFLIVLAAILTRSISINLSSTPQSTDPASVSVSRSQPAVPATLTAICNIDKTNNPLIYEIKDLLPTLRQIDLKGYVKKVNINQAKNMAAITLNSINGQQSYEFEIENISGQVYMGVKELKPADLKPLDNALITFNCNPKINSEWKFSRMSLSKPQK